jgi:hypothetical protein
MIAIRNYLNSGIDALNKSFADDLASKLARKSLYTGKLKYDVVVNMTSFPARISEVHYALLSLLSQSVKPKHIILWLSREEFPQGVDALPDALLRMMEFGVKIEWAQNYGPYNKLVHALLSYPEAINVTADDDVYYHDDWLKELYDEYSLHGDNFVFAHRAHRIRLNDFGLEKYCDWEREISDDSPSFLNLATGVGGVLYPPNSLLQQATDPKFFTEVAHTNDDLWFWAMGVLNGTQTRVTRKRNRLLYINPDRELRLSGEFTLAQKNVVELANDTYMQRIIMRYPKILVYLKNAAASRRLG